MRTVTAAVLIIAGLAIAGVVVWLLARTPDDREAELAATPGFALTLPDATLLWDHKSASLGGAGGDRTMAWGVQIDADAVAAYYAEQLEALGYEQVEGRSFSRRDAATTLAVFTRGDVWYRVRWVDLPHRIPGGTILTGGYAGVVYTTISNTERPRDGA
jgi:hypothetical protein